MTEMDLSNSGRACWSCQASSSGDFCPACGAVQPPGTWDHFARLGLDRSLDLDDAVLEHAYVDRQRALHPDRFVTRPVRERRYSVEQSMALNEAFEALRDPLTRAEYLVGMAGVEIDGEATTADQELLLEALEARETLADATSPETLAALASETRASLAACLKDVGARLAAGDSAGAAAATRRLRYLGKLADEIRRKRSSS